MAWTEEMVERLRVMTEAGRTAAEIACELGVTRNAVIGKWHRAGIKCPPYVRRRRVQAAVRRSGSSPPARRRQIKAPKAPKSSRRAPFRPYSDDERERIAQMWADYVDVREIARVLGRCYGGVRQQIYTMNLPTRDGYIVQRRNAAPDLWPIFVTHGADAFVAAYDARREQARAALQARRRQEAERWPVLAKRCLEAVQAGAPRDRAMWEARDQGCSLEALGKAFGITRERVRQICAKYGRENGLTDRHSVLRVGVDEEAVVRAVIDGVPVPEISRRLNVSAAVIRRVLAERRVRLRTVKERRRRIAEMYHAGGVTIDGLAERLGFHPHTIQAAVNEFRSGAHTVEAHQ